MDAEERLPDKVENAFDVESCTHNCYLCPGCNSKLRAAIREGYHEAFQRGQRDGESR